jgi:hypothetical protein
MAHALARGDFKRFMVLIDERDEWPPIWALVETPVFMVFGDHWSVGRALVAVLHGLSVIALFAIGLALPGFRGLLAGAAGAAFYAMSPFAQLMGTLILMEVPAIIPLAIVVIFYIRFCRWGRSFDATMTAVFTAVLFFHKFGYGTLWMATLALNELGHAIPSPRRLLKEGIPLLAQRILIFTGGPILIWFLFPRHLRVFLSYMGGIDMPPMALSDHLLYYPRSIVQMYSDPWWAGLAVLLLGLFSLRWFRQMSRAERILPIAMLTMLLIATSHGFKGHRFIFIAVPFVWMCAGWVIGLGVERFDILRARGAGHAVAVLLLVAALVKGVPHERAMELRDLWTSAPQTIEVVEDIAAIYEKSNGSALTGMWWDLSNQLIEWHLILTGRVDDSGKAVPGSRPFNPDWYGVGSGAEAVPLLEQDATIERVMVLQLPPGSPEYREVIERENRHLPEFKAAIERSRVFALEETRVYPATGYVLNVYARAPVDSTR